MSDTQHGASLRADAPKSPLKLIGFLVGTAALVAIVAMPQPAGLSVAGQHMLGIFVFAVVIWMTEAVDYAASAIMLMALITFLLGVAPDPAHPERALGTGPALAAALDRIHQSRRGADRCVAGHRRRHGNHRAGSARRL